MRVCGWCRIRGVGGVVSWPCRHCALYVPSTCPNSGHDTDICVHHRPEARRLFRLINKGKRRSEHLSYKEVVAGSIPTAPTEFRRPMSARLVCRPSWFELHLLRAKQVQMEPSAARGS